jgi:hypothetical protein
MREVKEKRERSRSDVLDDEEGPACDVDNDEEDANEDSVDAEDVDEEELMEESTEDVAEVDDKDPDEIEQDDEDDEADEGRVRGGEDVSTRIRAMRARMFCFSACSRASR